jgi:putative holliday junction resolvase
MRMLGIDYGTKRVGLALTDDKGMMAFPHSVVPNDSMLIKTIEALVKKEKVETIIIGHSLDREGNPNKVHAAVEELMLDLTLAVGVPIELQSEQYSTQEAKRIQGKTDKIDASAATIILNSYLVKTKK